MIINQREKASLLVELLKWIEMRLETNLVLVIVVVRLVLVLVHLIRIAVILLLVIKSRKSLAEAGNIQRKSESTARNTRNMIKNQRKIEKGVVLVLNLLLVIRIQ